MSQPANAVKTGVRTDIQGLRAIAVSLVVVFHLTPALLPGGYVGVDVFFVISGFLITAHLLREMASSGGVNLPRFWARRARRLLPAALVVLAVTVGAVWMIVPTGFRPSFLTQVASSALYFQNWTLANQAVDYMAQEAQASPVQHYWSLSTEEQFYIFWPLLMLVALWIWKKTHKGSTGGTHRAVGNAIGVITALSLVWSIWYTAVNPSGAYFVTTTRAWEFALGGAAALVVSVRPGLVEAIPQHARSLMGWAGLIAIGVTAVLYTGSTAFPGYAALVPVLGTLAVIFAQDPEPAWSSRGFLAWKPMQWLGDISYSVYLWHFPLVVLVPFALGHGRTLLDNLLIVVVTVLAAWASKEWIEDPVRRGLTSTWRPRVTFLATAGAMAGVVAITVAGVSAAGTKVDQEQDQLKAIVVSGEPCLGAAALEPGSNCDAEPMKPAIPDPALVDKSPERCIVNTRTDDFKVCDYGVSEKDADKVIAVVGDSHAEQWLSAMSLSAEEHQWNVKVISKASCPFVGIDRDEPSKSDASMASLVDTCHSWNEQALSYLKDTPEIDTVVTSAKSANPLKASPGESWQDTATTAYQERWEQLPDSIENIIAVRDTPRMESDVLDCVTNNKAEAAQDCASPMDHAFTEDPLAEAAQEDGDPRVSLVDMSDYFIVDGEVPPVIGGVLAFRDTHHISWVYSSTLSEPFGQKIQQAMSTSNA